MFSSVIFSVAALAAAPSVLATVFVTSPISSTTCTAGTPCTISWQDDGTAPALAAFAAADVGLWVGNSQQQTELQPIQQGVNVAVNSGIQFTPSASVGPNGNFYFIKFISEVAKDPSNAAIPAEAFSAKFTLTGMTGSFNASVSSQIAGITSAGGVASTVPPLSAPTTPASLTSASSKAASSGVSSTGSSKAASSTTSAAPKSSSSSGASRLAVSGAALVGAALFALTL
ncbi:hypothetical protein SISNIDRAFT_450807 [Sistotremastrum niveocremeum HHB9708]|uniref:Yeast cell wall synthesis Kre9/Knh1-like N-terminal domain-containing protein n=2 Tax=Sistotremastraceae TaxID=3402574 RepID=A0A164YKN8_9AGAM|nr:hypothetical protein SISNIDRAFT_450807 [Sistotremastrum niveocremeum HHB9708]KZT43428.1 hypothetical protein SISSUDRAFT_1040459 [Sistotremastrum suecicum HHB10207 ss-3]